MCTYQVSYSRKKDSLHNITKSITARDNQKEIQRWWSTKRGDVAISGSRLDMVISR